MKELPDEFFEDAESGNYFGINFDKYNSSDEPLEATKKLLAALEERRSKLAVLRKIEALENTQGRSPEEAAMYRSKAAELRARLESD